ncbi:MAG: hypothetical protein H6841_08860 [Planctomycetes bacterium]|nr:hypothetical protein [Planctomycetota bacterium]MCB9936135.1 hypothetical protein [Planctomycetota bacterium]
MSSLRIFALAVLLVLPATLFAQQQPTAAEAAFIYELNRARQNPQRYDTENSLGGILNGVSAQPALALNLNLVQSARFHSSEMAANGYFGHQSQVTGDWPNKMARDAGYPLVTAWTSNDNYIESLAALGSGSPGVSYSATAALKALIIDQGVVPPGHRQHLLGMTAFNAAFREVGTGYAQGLHWSSAPPASGAYWAVHTGRRDVDPVWLMGVVYDDANGNGRYDQGEGLSGVTVSATGSTTNSVQTGTAGMYMMQVSAGTTNLSCSGGAFSGTATRSITVGTANLAVDFASGRSSGELDFEFQQVGGGPVLTITSSMGVFNSPAPATPSPEQSYTVAGVRLVGNVTVTAPTDFQVSLTSGSGFGASVQLVPSAGTVPTTTIYVRFNPPAGSGASGDITHDTGGAIDSPVNLVGTVSTNPAIFCNPTSLNLAAARLGVASPEQSYSVSGYNLTANITVTAPAGFEVSLTSGSGFTGGLTLNHTGGVVSPTTVYARYTPTTLGATGNITHVAGAASQNVAVNGTVTNPPNITANPAALTLVAPTLGTPSAEQSFTISGQYLGGDISLTAPAGFDFTLTSGSGYVTSFNLTPVAGDVPTTTVFVRYLGGTASANGNITCSSTLATTRTVALTGTVAPPPNLTVTPLSLSFASQATGVPSGERTFTVAGANLLGAVNLAASADYEISLTSASGFGPNLLLNPTAGTLATTTIFARFVPSVTGTTPGTVTVTSSGATTRVVNLTGTISTGGGSGGGSDSGGGGCSGGGAGLPWLLLLALLAIPAVRRRKA